MNKSWYKIYRKWRTPWIISLRRSRIFTWLHHSHIWGFSTAIPHRVIKFSNLILNLMLWWRKWRSHRRLSIVQTLLLSIKVLSAIAKNLWKGSCRLSLSIKNKLSRKSFPHTIKVHCLREQMWLCLSQKLLRLVPISLHQM